LNYACVVSVQVVPLQADKWWEDIIPDKAYEKADYSGKMVLLLDLLAMSSERGDKALVFSQSLSTLDLIESFLTKLPWRGKKDEYWRQGKEWYR
jgi:transcriptional regulator ATRX